MSGVNECGWVFGFGVFKCKNNNINDLFFSISYQNPKRIYNIRTYKCYNNNKKNENIKEISYDDGDEWLLGWKKFNL